MEIEVFADIWCPFAHVSLHQLVPLRDELAPDTPILVRAWPLELVNGSPLDPGTTATHVAELRRDVAPDLFAGFDPRVMPRSTLGALALVEAANEADPWLGERLSLELRDAFFERGELLDVPMLSDLARHNGLSADVVFDRQSVERQWARGRARGVRGSPHFFVGGTDFFCPLLDIDRDEAGGLHLRDRLERMRGFLRLGLAEGRDPTPSTFGREGLR